MLTVSNNIESNSVGVTDGTAEAAVKLLGSFGILAVALPLLWAFGSRGPRVPRARAQLVVRRVVRNAPVGLAPGRDDGATPRLAGLLHDAVEQRLVLGGKDRLRL